MSQTEPAADARPPLTDLDRQLLDLAGVDVDTLTDKQLQWAPKVPERLKRFLFWALQHWPGRIVLRSAADFRRIQIFDRSMTIAAQLFTSVFPIIIMGAAFFGRDDTASMLGSLHVPSEAEDVINSAVTTNSSAASFGIVGTIVVLISATSLSRALTRAYDAVWHYDHSKSRLVDWWRWFAAVIALALAIVVTQRLVKLAEGLPPRDFWGIVVAFLIYTAIAVLMPWLLMAGRVRVIPLLPGALMFSVIMVLAHPAASRYISHAIESSAERYGAIGIAFTFITYLYCVSWVLLGTAVLGQVIVTDEAEVGQFIMRLGVSKAPPEAFPPGHPEASLHFPDVQTGGSFPLDEEDERRSESSEDYASGI